MIAGVSHLVGGGVPYYALLDRGGVGTRWRSRQRATTPAAWGEAIEVPENVVEPPRLRAEVMFSRIVICGAGFLDLWQHVAALRAIATVLVLGSARAFRKTVS